MDGAIFDMDGLLIDSERVYQRCWHMLAEEHGAVLDAAFPVAICGTTGDDTTAVVRRYFPGADAAAITAECRRQVREIDAHEIPLKPGVREILTGMRERGYRIAVASGSGMDLIRRNLEAHGIDGLFDVFVSGTEVARGKPFPDVFLLAAERLGCVPEACYVLEDSLNGIRAAHAAGCRAVMIPDLVPPTEEIKSFCFRIFPDLCAAWREIGMDKE